MYPDLTLLREVPRRRGVDAFALEPSLRGQRSVAFARDAVVLGVAHVLRRACIRQRNICDLEVSNLAHALADRLVTLQHGERRAASAPRRLSDRTVEWVADYIEADVTRRLTLEELARVAHVSPFHFARCFKATTGLPPHQFVLARRIELAKRLIMTTSQSVRDVAWAVGFENLSHCRRQFKAQIGVVPGILRRTTWRTGHQRAAS